MKLRELERGVILKNTKVPSSPKIKIIDVTGGGVIFIKPLTNRPLQPLEMYEIKEIMEIEGLEIDEKMSKVSKKQSNLDN